MATCRLSSPTQVLRDELHALAETERPRAGAGVRLAYVSASTGEVEIARQVAREHAADSTAARELWLDLTLTASAEEELDALFDVEPAPLPEQWLQIADTWLYRHKRLEKARRAAERGLTATGTRKPELTAALWRTYRVALGRIGDWEGMVTAIEAAEPPPEVLAHAAAVAFDRLDQPDRARELVERALKAALAGGPGAEIGLYLTDLALEIGGSYDRRVAWLERRLDLLTRESANTEELEAVRTLLARGEHADAENSPWRQTAAIGDDADPTRLPFLVRRLRLAESGDWNALVTTLEELAQQQEDAGLARSYLWRAAEILEFRLGDRTRACETWQRLTTVGGNERSRIGAELTAPDDSERERFLGSTCSDSDSRRRAALLRESGGDLEGARALLADAGLDPLRLDIVGADAQVKMGALRDRASRFRELAPETSSACWFAAGVLELDAGANDLARASFTHAVGLDASDLGARAGLVSILRDEEQWEDLVDELATVAESTKSRQTKALALGELGATLASRLDQPGPGRDALERAAELDPKNYAILELLGELRERDGEPAGALAIFRQATEVGAGRADTERSWLSIARLEESEEHADAALSAFEAARDCNPDSLEAIQGAQRIRRHAGEYDQLLSLLRAELKLQESHQRRVAVLLEIAEIEAAESAERGVEAFRSVATEAPDTPELYDGLRELGQTWACWRSIERLAAELPRSEARAALLMRACDEQGRWQEEVEARFEHIEFADDPAAKARRARELARIADTRQDVETAIRAYRTAVDGAPDHEPTRTAMLAFLEAQERWPELETALGESIDRLDRDDSDRRADLLLRSGRAQRNLGDSRAARTAFEAAIAVDPEHPGAIAALEQLADDDADGPGDRPSAGEERTAFLGAEETLCEQKRWPELLELYRTTIERVEHGNSRAFALPDLYERCGRIERECLGNRDRAIAEYRRSLELAPTRAGPLLALVELLEESEAWSDLIELLETRAQQADIADEQRLEALYRAADLATRHLGDEKRAVDLYHSVLDIDPGAESAANYLDRYYSRTRDWAALARVLEGRLERSDGKPAIELLLRVAALYEQYLQDEERAIGRYRQVLNRVPDHLAALEALGRIYESTERWQAFLETTEQQIQATSDRETRALLQFKCGSVWEAKYGDEDAAIRFYEQASEQSDCLPAVHGLRDIYVRRGEWRRAVASLELEANIWKQDKERAGVFAQIGDVLADHLEEPDQALEYWEQAHELDESCTPANLRLFDYHFGQADWAEARLFAEQLTPRLLRDRDLVDRAAFFHRRGIVLERTGNPELAAESLVSALEVDPSRLESVDALAAMVQESPWAFDFTTALKKLEQVYRKRDDCQRHLARVLVARALLETRSGDLDGARASYQAARECAPHDLGVIEATIEFHASLLSWADARQAIEEFLETEADLDAETRARLLIKLAELASEGEGDHGQARAALTRALESECAQTETEVRSLLAQELVLLGEYDQARSEMERVVELHSQPGAPASPEQLACDYYYLGYIAEESGTDDRLAASHYRRAHDFDPAYPPPALALARRAAASGSRDQAESILLSSAHIAMEKLGKRGAVPFQRGMAHLLLKSGDSPGAIDAYRGILSVIEAPEDRVALAEIYANDDLQRAISELQKALASDIRHAPAYRLLVRDYVRNGEIDRAARVLDVMELLGYAEQEDRETVRTVDADEPTPPIRRAIGPEDRELLETPEMRSPIGRLASVLGDALWERLPNQPLPAEVEALRDSADASWRIILADCSRMFGVEPPIYVASSIRRGVQVIGGRTPAVYLDRSLLEESEAARRFCLGAAFDAIRHQYAALLAAERPELAEYSYLFRELAQPRDHRSPRARSLLDRIPADKLPQVERWSRQLPPGDLEPWLDGVAGTALRAGLLACGDINESARMISRMQGEPMAVEAEHGAIGLVVCGEPLIRFFLSDDYHALREALTHPGQRPLRRGVPLGS